MSLINAEAQYRLTDQELGQLSLEDFSSSYIFQNYVFQDTTLPFLAFSEAECTLLCINKGFPIHCPLSPIMILQLPHCQDKQAKPQTWRSQGRRTSRKPSASNLLVTQQTLETLSLANLVRFFTTEISPAFDSCRNWIYRVLRLFLYLDYSWNNKQPSGRSEKGSSVSL